jgi:hypothetical protein
MKVVSKGLENSRMEDTLFGGPHPSLFPQGKGMLGLVSLTGQVFPPVEFVS